MKLPFRKRSLKQVKVLVIDEVLDEHLKPRTAYWFAQVPRDEMEQVNPRGYGAYHNTPTLQRILTLILTPVLLTLILGGVLWVKFMPYLSQGLDIKMLLAAVVLLGALGGIPVGLLAAWIVCKLVWRTELLFVLGRVETSLAKSMGLYVPEGAAYGVVWAMPPPLIARERAHVDMTALREQLLGAGYSKERVESLLLTFSAVNDAAAMNDDSEKDLWQLETLLRGVGGEATRNYLAGMEASARREDKRWGGRMGNAFSHDGNNQGAPSSNRPDSGGGM